MGPKQESKRPDGARRVRCGAIVGAMSVILLGAAAPMRAQSGGGSGTSQTGGGSGASSSGGGNGGGSASGSLSVSQVNQAQQQLTGAGGSGSSSQVTSDSYKGSIVSGTATTGEVDLSLDEAIQRGLRTNLGVILQSSSEKNASGQRLEQLQALLPTVTGQASYEVEQLNLAAFGI